MRNRLLDAALAVVALALFSVAASGQTAPKPAEGATKAKAWVFCVSEPDGAKILMGHPMSPDNWEKGVTPKRIEIFEAGPEPRQLRVTFVKPGYEPYSAVVSVREGDELKVVANLSPRRMMAYVSDAKLVIANADGSVPTEVASLEQPVSTEAPAWFADSRSLCLWEAGALWRRTPDGEPKGKIATPADVSQALGLRQPVELREARVLASGRWVTFLARWGGHSSVSLLASAEGGRAPEVLLPDCYGLRVSPTEDRIVALTREGASLVEIEESGEARLVRTVAGATDAAFSADGARIALALRGEVYVGDGRLAEVSQLTSSEEAGPSELLWSPEGTQILCTIHRQASRNQSWDELWMLAAPGEIGEPQLVLDGRTHPNAPDLSALAFMPYSTRLVYRSGTRTYALDLADPSSDTLLLFNSGFPSWSSPTTEDVGPEPGEDRPPLVDPALEAAEALLPPREGGPQ